MLKNKNIDYSEIIQFTNSGIAVADYPLIRSSLVEKFKEIYGSDIDLSTGSADGIYIETLSLLINNICQAFKQFYSSLDIQTASGKSLELLCSLSNVSRKPATYSTASINVTLNDTETTFTTNSISFLDKNGNEWKYESANNPLTFEPGITQTIIVTCTQLGPIKAEKGWINKTLDTQVLMSVQQLEDANVGSNEETDNQLRARRNQSLGSTGITVLESLVGSLLSLTGINDVKIYNNDSNEIITTKDNTKINSHEVYVIIRKNNNIEIADSLIGSIIYEKMTPGIMTVSFTGNKTNGINHTYKYRQYILGEEVEPDIIQNVNWKEAVAVKPQIVITIKTKENFASANNSTLNLIANNVITYLNNLQLSTNITPLNISDEAEYADPLFRGRSTFNIDSVTIDGKTTEFKNLDTFYNYTTISYNKIDNTTYIITLS